MALRQALRSGVAAICIGATAAPASIAAPAARAAIEVRVAQARDFSRIEFRGAGAVARRDGQALTLTFNRDDDPDIARLKVDPPRWIKSARAAHTGGRLQIVLTLADDADAKIGRADGATYVNVFERKAPEEPAADASEQAAATEPEPARPDPLPPGGVVRMEAKVDHGQTFLTFPFARPAGAAVFRRGDAVWVVFDAPAKLDVSKAPRGVREVGQIQSMRGADHAAIRVVSPAGTPVFALSQGPVWTIAFGPGAQSRASLVRVTRDAAGGPAALKAPLAGVTRIVRVADPAVGDVLTVATALGPAKGLPSRREYVQLALLASMQGLAAESYIEDLEVARDGDVLRFGRPEGLALSPTWAIREREAASELGAPKPAAMPALIGADWAKTGSGGFLARYNALLSAATDETAAGRDAPTSARMALARFLVGSELSFEAIGVLNAAARAKPALMDDPEFRGLRGIARVMARRYKEAQADFSSPALADDPSSGLWRAYAAAQLAEWPEARQQFGAGAQAFNQFGPDWKARFARADAQAALALGDLDGAASRINLALMDPPSSMEVLSTRLLQARIVEAMGHKDRALRIYAAISQAPAEQLSAPALLRATQIRMETGKITPVQAAAVFDGLRYRWRGDATELETIRLLGRLYLDQGRYREALEALRSAGQRMPDLPEALQLQADLAAAFRALFLDGLADGLEPVQALALFYDFKELTPIGADGDLMVRKLVRRLVDVDLLDQAAILLKYQSEHRLDGPARAQVATDLALIYLMDRKPEQAIQAINNSRTTVLPSALNAERRLIEARAWSALGRNDSALEILGKDASREAEELRGEITWRQKNWASAGGLFEKALGARWKRTVPLTAEEEGRLLRAGVAYSLAGDDEALARLRHRYQGFYDEARNPEALRVALSGVADGPLGVADFGRITADNEAFAGWVDRMKQRFRQPPAPVKQAQAAAPATKG